MKTEPTTQELYVAKFTAQTGFKPASEVKMAMRAMSRTKFYAGLEAQVSFRGLDGEDFLKTIFTPIKQYMRDNNKYVPHHNQRRLNGPQDETLLPQAEVPEAAEPQAVESDAEADRQPDSGGTDE